MERKIVRKADPLQETVRPGFRLHKERFYPATENENLPEIIASGGRRKEEERGRVRWRAGGRRAG